jgi:hypothetical protein
VTEKRIIVRVPVKQRPLSEGGGATPGGAAPSDAADLARLSGVGERRDAERSSPGGNSAVRPNDTQLIPPMSSPRPPTPLREFKFVLCCVARSWQLPKAWQARAQSVPNVRASLKCHRLFSRRRHPSSRNSVYATRSRRRSSFIAFAVGKGWRWNVQWRLHKCFARSATAGSLFPDLRTNRKMAGTT